MKSHKPPSPYLLLFLMTTVTRGKTQQKTSHRACDCQPVGRGETPTVLELRNQERQPRTAPPDAKMQESAPGRSLPLSFWPLALKKHSGASVAVPHAPRAAQCYPREISAPGAAHRPAAANGTAKEGAPPVLLPKWPIQGGDKCFAITIWVWPFIQTPLITVNGSGQGSGKFEVVRHSPSPPQGLQTTHGTTWKPISNQPKNE